MSDMITVASIRQSHTEELQSFEEGEWVEYDDGLFGIVVGKEDGPIQWPTGEDSEEQVGESGENVYIVARESGGSKPFLADELNGAERSDVFDEDDDVPEDPVKDIEGAELSQVYYRVDDPTDYDELVEAQEQLLSVPGVDDPGVGWDSYPDSWVKADKPARLILLDAWTSMQSSWTGCMAEIKSKRICSSMKSEVYGTERWRRRF